MRETSQAEGLLRNRYWLPLACLTQFLRQRLNQQVWLLAKTRWLLLYQRQEEGLRLVFLPQEFPSSYQD